MAVKRISEKEFRTRRRDRRMVWVDTLAFLIGLLIVTASVGGVIFYEPEPEPIEWQPVFVENRLNEYRTCYGFEGGAQQGQGCSTPLSSGLQKEGEEVSSDEFPAIWPAVTEANVTRVSFALRWLDDVPSTDGPCADNKYCARDWDYNENSTAILNLTVITPWGEVFGAEDMNNWEGVSTGDGVPSGAVHLDIPVLELPAEGESYHGFSQDEAEAAFNQTYYQGDHKGLGEWTTIVTVVRASSMNGTFPSNACQAAGLPEEEIGEENCDIYDEYELVFGPGQGLGDGGVPSTYPGYYGAMYTYGAILGPATSAVPEEYQYRSSYQSEGQSWTLSMTVRGYEAIAGV